LAIETGGMSLLVEQAMEQTAGQILTEAFSGALDAIGVTGAPNQLITEALRTGYDLGSGNVAGLLQDAPSLAHDAVESAYQNGGLAQALSNLNDACTQLLDQALQNQKQRDETDPTGKNSGRTGGESWLVALAEAQGAMLGDIANKMVKYQGQLTQHANDKDPKQFMDINSKLQAESQMFSLMSNSFSSVLKSLGEGMTAIARK
jgi:hypothetical protein